MLEYPLGNEGILVRLTKRHQIEEEEESKPLLKIHSGIAKALCLGLVLALSSTSALASATKKTNDSDKENESSIEAFSNEDISGDDVIEIENEDIENWSFSPSTLKYMEVETDHCNVALEIQNLLDKYQISNQELIEVVTSVPEYNLALQNILYFHPEITSGRLMAILEGENSALRDDLFIGDSRLSGMLICGVLEEENSIYGVGYGYNWFIGNGAFPANKTNALNGAIEASKEKMRENKPYNIVIWLGVNDYTHVDANVYFNKYVELARNEWSNQNIYIVSVGPVKDSRASSVDNRGIENYNRMLEELIAHSSLNNLHYIDLHLDESSIQKYDGSGLHYGNEDYQNIYNEIRQNITENENAVVDEILNIFYSALISYDTAYSESVTKEMIYKGKKN